MNYQEVKMKKIALSQKVDKKKSVWCISIVYTSTLRDTVVYMPTKLQALGIVYAMCELHGQELPSTPHKGKDAEIYYFR